jgi:hypothetical protein
VSRDDEGQVAGRQSVVSGRDSPTLLDLIEEPFDQIAGPRTRRTEGTDSMALRLLGRWVGGVQKWNSAPAVIVGPLMAQNASCAE